MKRHIFTFAAAILIAFFGLATFAFVSMGHGDMGHGGSDDCVASVFDGAVCVTGVLGSVPHHISAYQSFVNVTIAGTVSAALALAAAVLAFELRARDPGLDDLISDRLAYSRVESAERDGPERRSISWLALFEHSPSS